MDVAASVLLEGSWYSLEQCGRLLASAVALYKEKDYSTAVAIAMFAHEELGKCRILLDEWKKAVETGKLPNVEQIKHACGDHIEKQMRGQGSVILEPASGSALGMAIKNAIENAKTPTVPAYRAADKRIKAEVDAKGEHDPEVRHEIRLEGIFVDLGDWGKAWKRPCKTFSEGESLRLLRNAVNNYAEQRDGFSNTAKLKNRELAKELDTWTGKPVLPEPNCP